MQTLEQTPTVKTTTTISIPELRAALIGQVIAPGDAGYDKARAIHNDGVDLRPALIVRAANASDVSYVVTLARDLGLELAVRSGGHSLAAHSASEGGIVLDLSGMKTLEIDPENRTAWADSGLTAGEYTRAAGAYGLATGFGDAGSVGVGGITLGGGIGFLVRKYGMTIDSLLAVEIVIADGQVIVATEESHPDLFWAIRGGGGNFGVVTRFKFRLHEVNMVVGGMMLLPATEEVLASVIAEADRAPEELSVIVNVMPTPPLPFVPAEHCGKLVVMALMCYAGDIEAGQRAIAPFRAIATPLVDMVQPMPYSMIYPPSEEHGPGMTGHTMFLDSFDQGTAQTILDNLRKAGPGMHIAQLRVLGGAMARVPARATAFAHRSRRIMAMLAAFYMSPQERAERDAWIAGLAAALRSSETIAAGVYVNFLGEEGAERVREAYPGETWDRLREIKAKYDPANLFHRNQNIPPAN